MPTLLVALCAPKRPGLNRTDRLLARLWPNWRRAVQIVTLSTACASVWTIVRQLRDST